jgi:predicted DNA-binding protein with PD1-like motif
MKPEWNHERIRELHAFCKQHGVQAAANCYRLSIGRVHDLVRRLAQWEAEKAGEITPRVQR